MNIGSSVSYFFFIKSLIIQIFRMTDKEDFLFLKYLRSVNKHDSKKRVAIT